MPKSRKNPRRKVNRTPQPSIYKKEKIKVKQLRVKFNIPYDGRVLEVDQEILRFNSHVFLELINKYNPMDVTTVKTDITNTYALEVLDENSPFGKQSYASEISWIYNGISKNGYVNYVGGIFKNGDINRPFFSNCYQIEGKVCFEICEYLGNDKIKIIAIISFKQPTKMSNDNLLSLAQKFLFGPVLSKF